METTLQLPDDSSLYYDNTYSVCLPGARQFHDTVDVIYGDRHLIATIHSQLQFRFCDLVQQDLRDYYDSTVTDVFKLHHHMSTVHWRFDERMIVTIVRFQITR